MAEDKKSFILYCDLISVVEKLIVKDRENKTNYAGELFFHILKYVNDQNPISIDFIIEMAFEPIKLQLKRDLKKFIEAKEEKSLAGRIGNLKRWNSDLYKEVLENKMTIEEAEEIAKNRKLSHTDNVRSHPIANIAVNDTVTVTDNVNDNVNDTVSVISKVDSSVEVPKTSPPKQTKKTIEERKQIFYEKVAEFKNEYSKEMLKDFFEYWTEHGENDHKMRFEKKETFGMSLRLKNWNKNNLNYKNNGKSNSTLSAQEQLDKRKAEITQRNKERFGDFDEFQTVF